MRSLKRMTRPLAAFLALLMILGTCTHASARSVSGLENDISEQEKKEQEAKAEAAYYQGLYDELQTELQAAQEETDTLLEEMLETDRKLTEAEAEVEYFTQLIEENAATLAEQKDAMSKRIQYMYEQQNSSFWEVLTGARSLAEVMNSADYITSLSEYDNKMMEAYKAALAESERLKAESVAKQEEITAYRDELIEKQAAMAEKTQDIIDRMNDFQEKINASKAAAAAYAAQAAQKKSELEQLKLAIRRAEEEAARKRAEEARRKAEEEARRKAEEEARKKAEAAAKAAAEAAAAEAARKKAEEEAAAAAAAAAAANNNSGSSNGLPSDLRWKLNDKRGVGSTNIDPNAVNPTGKTNLELLAALLECECGGQPYNAQVAVGNVVFNRILSPRWQTTLYDVIMGRGQFTPVDNGYLAIVLAKGAKQRCVDIARDCFNGARVLDTKWLFFCDFNDWRSHPRSYTEYKVLGAHIFYY